MRHLSEDHSNGSNANCHTVDEDTEGENKSLVLVSTTEDCGARLFCISVCAAVSTAVWAPLVEVGCHSAWTLYLELQRCIPGLLL